MNSNTSAVFVIQLLVELRKTRFMQFQSVKDCKLVKQLIPEYNQNSEMFAGTISDNRSKRQHRTLVQNW